MWASFLISQKLRFLICKMTTLNCCGDEMGQVLQGTVCITPTLASSLVTGSVCGFGQYCRTERETDVHAPPPPPCPRCSPCGVAYFRPMSLTKTTLGQDPKLDSHPPPTAESVTVAGFAQLRRYEVQGPWCLKFLPF